MGSGSRDWRKEVLEPDACRRGGKLLVACNGYFSLSREAKNGNEGAEDDLVYPN